MITRIWPKVFFPLILGAVLAWCPMPFGSVLPWSEAVLTVAVLVLAAAGLATGGAGTVWRALQVPLLALAALAAFGGLQALAWPHGLTASLSPEHVRLADAAFSAVGDSATRVPLSLAPWATRGVALAVVGLIASLVAGATLGKERIGRRVILGAVLAAGVFEAFLGAQLWFARSRTIWGVEVPTQPWRLHGTFVNPDHLAYYLEIGLALAFAWGWWAARRTRDAAPDVRLLFVSPPALAWLVLFLALAFSGSRAGLLGALAGVGTQAAILAAAGRRLKPLLIGAAVTAVALAAVASVGLREGLGRFAQAGRFDVSLMARVDVTRATFDIWRRFPIFGSGLGTFEEAFPLVEPAKLAGSLWHHAHNDPVELLATGGLVAVALVAIALAALGRRLWRSATRGARSEDRAAGIAALGALASFALHELAEFGLTMPANAVTLAVVCGAAAVVPRARTTPAAVPGA